MDREIPGKKSNTDVIVTSLHQFNSHHQALSNLVDWVQRSLKANELYQELNFQQINWRQQNLFRYSTWSKLETFHAIWNNSKVIRNKQTDTASLFCLPRSLYIKLNWVKRQEDKQTNKQTCKPKFNNNQYERKKARTHKFPTQMCSQSHHTAWPRGGLRVVTWSKKWCNKQNFHKIELNQWKNWNW